MLFCKMGDILFANALADEYENKVGIVFQFQDGLQQGIQWMDLRMISGIHYHESFAKFIFTPEWIFFAGPAVGFFHDGPYRHDMQIPLFPATLHKIFLHIFIQNNNRVGIPDDIISNAFCDPCEK